MRRRRGGGAARLPRRDPAARAAMRKGLRDAVIVSEREGRHGCARMPAWEWDMGIEFQMGRARLAV